MVFFLCVVFLYYRGLIYSTKQTFVDKGRISAIESANKIDQSITPSLDILKLTSHSLDTMIEDNVPNDEILDYLKRETTAVSDSLIADTTGIYGYINGVYMDGSGWDPGDGYDAASRPWYIEAINGGGKISVVDPYLDLDTGKMMIALVKTLCDGESVVGIDISMDEIQNILGEHVSEEISNAEFIVNSKGVIVAHSDPELIGRNINDGDDKLFKAVSGMTGSGEKAYKYLDYDGRDYLLYSVPLENEWTCISVIDGSDDFGKLHISLYITIFIAGIIVVVFLIFMQTSEKRSRDIRKASIETKQAIAASEAKTSFLSKISHEIRTPVNAILGMNEMISRESRDDEVLLFSENIKSAGESLLDTINDILEFSKIEDGKIEIKPVYYDLSSLIDDILNKVIKRAEDKGITLNLDLDKEIPKNLYGDAVHLKQIITNILTNAVKYTEKGSVTFRMGYKWIDDDPDGVLIDVSVKDTCIGIKKEDLNLGMGITKSLLEMMGSDLHVESVHGEGSVFGFRVRQEVTGKGRLGDYKVKEKPINPQKCAPREDTSSNDEAMAKIISGLKDQDQIDIYEGIENSGSAESYLSMLEMFHKLYDENVSELKKFYSEGNIDEYTIKVHSVKSSGKIIGAYEFGEKAQLLENASKEGDTEYIEAHHEELLKDLRGLKEIIEPLF